MLYFRLLSHYKSNLSHCRNNLSHYKNNLSHTETGFSFRKNKDAVLENRGSLWRKIRFYLFQTEALFRANKGSILFQIEYLFYFRQSICLDIQSSFFFHSLILFFFIPYSFLFIPLFLPLRLQSQSLNSKLNCSQTPCCSSASSFGLETERPMSRIGCCSNSTLLSNSFASGSTRSKVVSSCD